MPSYTFKEGMCAECGSKYKGLICDEAPLQNHCPRCRTNAAVENARSLYYREFIPYWDRSMGRMISSQRERQDGMAELGLVDISDVAPNPDYMMQDLEGYAESRKKDRAKQEEKNFKVDDQFLEVYREVEASHGK